MAYIRWDESLSVGVAEIDEQHRRLFALVDALHELCAAACSPGALMAAVEEFCDYTRHHFATEERYMDAYEYRGMDAHIQEHMRCSLRAVDFLGQCLEGDPALCDEFLAFLKDWLETHVKNTDMGLGAYLNKRGVA
jgi:hemerythrin-like metal-binding protein